MTFPKARLVVSLCLFLGWLGFLFYLVLERRTVILSQPQFLISQAIVVAELRDIDGVAEADVTVKEVPWSADAADQQLQKLTLLELPAQAQGYQGPGVYVLPLRKRDGRFSIAPLPTPGAPVRIYPWTAETRAQVNEIRAAKK